MTMLLVNNLHELQHHSYYFNHHRMPSTPSALSMLNLFSMGGHDQEQPAASPTALSDNNEVAQALEIARESPDGAKDPVISSILENALAQIWSRVQARPDCYVMSRDEFAVFNYFQHRFKDNKVAVAARKRFWDNTTAA